MYKKSAFVFWTTLVLYVLTLFTVSYVGVYLTYIAIPLILISGLIMMLSKPKKKAMEENSEVVSPVKEFGKAVSSVLDEVNTSLGGFNSSLENYNIKMDLIKNRTEGLKEKRNKLELEKIKHEIELKYSKIKDEIDDNKKTIKEIDEQIKKVDLQIDEVKKQCELEVMQQHNVLAYRDRTPHQ